MTDGASITKDLVVITALTMRLHTRSYRHCLISKEMDRIVILQKLETVRLVPSLGNHVEGNLTADEIHKVHVRELLLQHFHHLLANVVLLVVLAKGVSLLLGAVAANGADIDHAGAEFDEGSSVRYLQS